MNISLLFSMVTLLLLSGFYQGCGNSDQAVNEPKKQVLEASASYARMEARVASIQHEVKKLAPKIAAIASQRARIDSLSDTLELTDLTERTYSVTSDDSETLFQLFSLVKELTKNVEDFQKQKIEEQVNAVSEEIDTDKKKLADGEDVNQIIDKLTGIRQMASQYTKQAEDALENALAKSNSLVKKIDDGSVNTRKHFGDKVVDIDMAIASANAANTIQEIENILEDGRFANLAEEVEETNNGPAFQLKLVELKKLLGADGASDSVPARAQKIKDEIDGYFAAAPTTQADIDRLANNLDQVLEDPASPFEAYAQTQGRTFPEIVRKRAVRQLVWEGDSGRKKAGNIVKVNGAMALLEEDINKVKPGTLSIARLVAALKKVVDTALGQFYNDAKLGTIKAAIQAAGEDAYYFPTYDRLITAIQPFTIDAIINILRKNNVDASQSEADFNANLNELVTVFKDPIYNNIVAKKDARIRDYINIQRVTFTATGTVVDIERILNRMKALEISIPTYIDDIENDCLDLSTNFLQIPIDCAQIKARMQAPMEPTLALPQIKAEARKRLESAKDIIDSSIRPQLDAVNSAPDKTGFNQEFALFNAKLKPAKVVLPLANPRDYSIADLVNEIITHLRTVAYAGRTYEATINELAGDLDPLMTSADIDVIKGKFNQRPISPLEQQLRTFLRPESMKIITQYFTIPDIPGKLVFMKKAALADNNGDGIPAFEKAYQNVLDSFDEHSSDVAVRNFATFFNDKAIGIRDPVKYYSKLNEIAAMPGTIPSLVEQRDFLQNTVSKRDEYVAIKNLAELANNLSKKLFEAAPPPNLSITKWYSSLPLGLKKAISGGEEAAEINVVVHFREMKDLLLLSLEEIKIKIPKSDILERNKANIEPIVNSFKLLFYYPFTELNTLPVNNETVKKHLNFIESSELKKYLNLFKRFKSIVGENETIAPPPVVRPIITLLRSLLVNLNAAIATPEIDKLKIYINAFLQ